MERGASFEIHGVQQGGKRAIPANESNHILLVVLNGTMQKVPSLAIYQFRVVRASLHKLGNVPDVPHHGGDVYRKQAFVVRNTRH